MSIKVNFAALAEAASQISSAERKISTELENLEGRVKAVLEDYDGDSADAYHAAQREWDLAAADLAQVLSSVGIGVRAAGEAYEEGERRNAARW